MKMLFGPVLASILCGCGTISPNEVKDLVPSYDASTPEGTKLSSGFLGFTSDASGDTDGALLTENAVSRYNLLLCDYRLQLEQSIDVYVNPGDGIKPQPDINGVKVFWIDAQHLQYFLKLSRWKKDGLPSDTLWMRVKGAL